MNKSLLTFVLAGTVAAAALLPCRSAQAVVLIDWNLDQVTGPTTNNTPFAGVDAADATVAPGLISSNLVSGSSPGHAGLVWSGGNTGPNKLNLQRWDHPGDNPSLFGNGNGTPNNWLEFDLSAAPGLFYEVTSVDVSAWRNGAGAPASWRIDYSTDGGLTWTQFGSTHVESNAGDGVFRDVTFTDSVQGDDLRFRFAATGPDGGSGNLHINQLSFSGSVVPEPSRAVLATLGLGLLLGLRRRR